MDNVSRETKQKEKDGLAPGYRKYLINEGGKKY